MDTDRERKIDNERNIDRDRENEIQTKTERKKNGARHRKKFKD